MEKRGIRTEKGEWNRYIKSINRTMKKLLSYIAEIREAIRELKKEEAKQAYKLKCRIADAYKQTQRNTKREEQSL